MGSFIIDSLHDIVTTRSCIIFAGHVAHTGGRSAYRVLVANLMGRDQMGDRRRWEDLIRMDLKEMDANIWTGCI
jgi:hypothetical protein